MEKIFIMKIMLIDIICPLYNGSKYLHSLHSSLLNQKGVEINKIRYILSDTNDGSFEILANLEKCIFKVINPSCFSHSLTREKEAFESKADIIVFITQDIIIIKEDWLEKLVTPIINGECEASYSRQISGNSTIEKYTRDFNYPSNSFIKGYEDIETMGFRTFFFSDASSAIKLSVFKQLRGYDGKDFASNEDEYFAYKLIMNGFHIKYCADSEVIHSHTYSLRQLYKRYYASGLFLGENTYLNQYKINNSGYEMAKYIFICAIVDRNLVVLITFFPNMIARFLGMMMGKLKANNCSKT